MCSRWGRIWLGPPCGTVPTACCRVYCSLITTEDEPVIVPTKTPAGPLAGVLDALLERSAVGFSSGISRRSPADS